MWTTIAALLAGGNRALVYDPVTTPANADRAIVVSRSLTISTIPSPRVKEVPLIEHSASGGTAFSGDGVRILQSSQEFAGPTIDIHPAFAPPTSPQPRRRRRLSPKARFWMVVALSVVVAATALVGLRSPISQAIPGASGAYALLGIPVESANLEIGGVQLVRIYSRGWVTLTVEGNISNTTGRQMQLPSLDFTLHSSDGRDIRNWQIPLGQSVVDPGGRVRFATDIEDLPSGATHLTLTLGDASPLLFALN